MPEPASQLTDLALLARVITRLSWWKHSEDCGENNAAENGELDSFDPEDPYGPNCECGINELRRNLKEAQEGLTAAAMEAAHAKEVLMFLLDTARIFTSPAEFETSALYRKFDGNLDEFTSRVHWAEDLLLGP